MTDALQPEIFEPGQYLQPQRQPAYFSLLVKPQGHAVQSSYPVDRLADVVRGVDRRHDSYISQALFSGRNRRAVNLRSVAILFGDLDVYRVESLAGKPPEYAAAKLIEYCSEQGIPLPSLVLYSGRGMYGKWLLAEGIGAPELMDWNTVERALVDALEPFGADRQAKDVSRVLRLDHTVNTKSGDVCRVVLTIGDPPLRYTFEQMAKALRPWIPTPTRRRKPADGTVLQFPFSDRKLYWDRFHDLGRLWELRGGVPEGWRETTLFWRLNCLLRADPSRTIDLWKEAQALAASIDPGKAWWTQGDLSTLYRKAQAHLRGEVVIFAGKEKTPLYGPRNSYLMDVFEITPEEEREMKTIVSTAEKRRRERERRRAAGVQPRDGWLAENSAERERPWEALGISRRTWYYRRTTRS